MFGHGFLTKDGLKMGKALGNTLNPAALVGAYGADAVRLFFMKEVGEWVGGCTVCMPWEGGGSLRRGGRRCGPVGVLGVSSLLG